jgi:hypothetical protein
MALRRTARAGLMAAAVALAVAVGSAQASDVAPDARPGCAPERPAVAHHQGGVALDPQPAGAPIPCGVLTGFGSSETRVAVNGSGTVFFNPAVATPGPTQCAGRCESAGLAISTDRGATWSLSPSGSNVDNSLYADPDTNRVFWIPFNVAAAQAEVRISDDDGKTWRTSSACCGSAENPRFMTGVPRVSRTIGYPKVVYLCSNTGYIGGLESVAGARVCSKSLDGGTTFTLIGVLFSKPVAQHSQCLPYGDEFGATDNHDPQAAPDGSLYLLVRCGGAAPDTTDTEYLARSDDEAATWTVLHKVPLPAAPSLDLDELRVDTGGNLYLVRTDPTTFHPLLRVSSDEGATWGPELDVAAPGVEVGAPKNAVSHVFISPHLWEVAVKEPGHVAVGYYGRPTGQTRWDGYLTETWNALAVQPLFWSGRLNADSIDLTDGVTASIGNDFMGTTIAPDGTAWASFFHSVGFAGRLVRADGPDRRRATGRGAVGPVGVAGRGPLPTVR